MPRSFRFAPPEPRPELLTRPRLLRSLAGRWQHRVTSLTGGPGLGKTTLLAQAIAENRLSPRGEDVWIGIEPHDADADSLSRVVATALAGEGEQGAPRVMSGQESVLDPARLADVVWHRAPAEACLVLDDVHLLPPGSTGAAWLNGLVEAMPANGHVVFASRSEPPVPLTRLGSQGAVLLLAEDDLRFSDDELSGFAQRRGLDPGCFGDTGGWPAMAELAASVERRLTGKYLWEQVLEPLGTVRRHILAVLCDLGGADDELASAAVGSPVDLVRALDGVPLVARGAEGWYVPHGLWRTAPGIELAEMERADIRRRAAEHLQERGRYEEAFNLVEQAGLWDGAPAVLRAACLTSDRLAARQLGRWLAASPEAVRASPAGHLAGGLHAAFTTPARAVEPLQEAVATCRAVGDVDAELAAVAELGKLAWWRQDLGALAELAPRVSELAATGHSTAGGLAAFARALTADLAGDHKTAIAELGSIETGVLDPTWGALASWLYGEARLNLGQAEAAGEIAERLSATADPAMRYILDTLQLRAWWSQGRVDDAIAKTPSVIAAARRTGVTYIFYLGVSIASVGYSHTGDVVAARRALDEALAAAPPSRDDKLSVLSAMGTASLQLAAGDEAQAATTLREAVETRGLDRGLDRRAWQLSLPLTYVLIPETRSHWDAVAARGHAHRTTELASAVVALREGQGESRLRHLTLPHIGQIRAILHVRFAAELAVGLHAVGRSEGRALLEALGPAGRAAVRDLLTTQPRQAKPAKSLLATVPAPPPRSSYLAVLGSLVVRRDGPDGDEVTDPDLRRKKVQELVAFLVGHRRTTRAAIAAALWPDLDERAAGNNLGVTLNHVLRLIDPWRDSGDPAYLLRMEGSAVRLVTGEHLRIDVDEFDEHLAAAAQAEADGIPSVALEHDLAAVDLYRDDLHLEVAETPWFALEREHYRSRFVSAAVRAGQLLLGHRDNDRAAAVAHRALAVDQWSEDAYDVLVGAALARGDRSGARRMLSRCLAALDDLGAEPSDATRQLERRVHGSDPSRN